MTGLPGRRRPDVEGTRDTRCDHGAAHMWANSTCTATAVQSTGR